jgi:hypothetical protein
MTGDKKDKALHRSWDLLQSKSMNLAVRLDVYLGRAAERSFRHSLHYKRRAGRPDAIINYAEKKNIHLVVICTRVKLGSNGYCLAMLL